MKMLAAVLYEAGKPKPYAASRPLVIEGVELDPPGPGEVLVKVAAAGLCHSDLAVVDGTRNRPLPTVPGHEAAGVVVELGSNVKDLAVGDHVVFSFLPICGDCEYCRQRRFSLCAAGVRANAGGTLLTGARRLRAAGQPLHHFLGVSAFAEYAVAARQSVVRVDPTVDPAHAALFGCAIMTGVGAMLNAANVQAGSSVAVFGMGGVGLSAVMGAALAQASTIVAVDRLDSKLVLARQAGATHTRQADDHDLVQAIRDITRGGAHYTLEAVGHERVLELAFAATRPGGKTVAIGLPHPAKRAQLSPLQLVMEERTLVGSFMGSCEPARDIPRFIAHHVAGRLPLGLLCSSTLRLHDINEALDELDRGEVARQIILFD